MLLRCVCFAWIVMAVCANAGAQQTESVRYQTYESATRAITEMEWGLLQVNVRGAAQQVEVGFDAASRRFRADTWILPRELQQLPSAVLQARMQAKVKLVRTLIGRFFREFRESGGRDLKMQFLLAEQANTVIAIWENETLTLTDAYRDALQRQGRR